MFMKRAVNWPSWYLSRPITQCNTSRFFENVMSKSRSLVLFKKCYIVLAVPRCHWYWCSIRLFIVYSSCYTVTLVFCITTFLTSASTRIARVKASQVYISRRLHSLSSGQSFKSLYEYHNFLGGWDSKLHC